MREIYLVREKDIPRKERESVRTTWDSLFSAVYKRSRDTGARDTYTGRVGIGGDDRVYDVVVSSYYFDKKGRPEEIVVALEVDGILTEIGSSRATWKKNEPRVSDVEINLAVKDPATILNPEGMGQLAMTIVNSPLSLVQ